MTESGGREIICMCLFVITEKLYLKPAPLGQRASQVPGEFQEVEGEACRICILLPTIQGDSLCATARLVSASMPSSQCLAKVNVNSRDNACVHRCCVSSKSGSQGVQRLPVAQPRRVFRASCCFCLLQIFVSKKIKITYFPNRLSWCSVFLVIKILMQLWGFELVNIPNV